MRIILSFLLLVSCLSAKTPLIPKKDVNHTKVKDFDDSDRILWKSSVKLSWVDFQGKPKEDVGAIVAETAGEIVTVESYWEGDIPRFKLACFFLKKESWTTTDSEQALKHEKLHFDIYEIFTRKIRKEYDKLNRNGIVDFSVYEDVFNKYIDECSKLNDEYDSQVYFNDEKQQQWYVDIANQLEELKDYQYK